MRLNIRCKDTLTGFLSGNRNELPAKLESISHSIIEYCENRIKNPSAVENAKLEIIKYSLPIVCQRVIADDIAIDKFVTFVVTLANFY